MLAKPGVGVKFHFLPRFSVNLLAGVLLHLLISGCLCHSMLPVRREAEDFST